MSSIHQSLLLTTYGYGCVLDLNPPSSILLIHINRSKMCSTLHFFIMFIRFFLIWLIFLEPFCSMINATTNAFTQQPLCHETESSALIQFNQSLAIDEHASSDPFAYPKVAAWDSHADCCSWDGVVCDEETGHVIGLHLRSSCLYGSINSRSTLFRLVHLRILDLSDNDFNFSSIPPEIGHLSRLTSLCLWNSRFSGQVPPQLLALSNLVVLDLSTNTDPWGNPLLQLQNPSLTHLAHNLTRLEKVYLSLVNMSSTTVPHALAANLHSLTHLFLDECGLQGEFPANIFQLPSLQYLSVSFNPDLTGYLPEFQETSPLKELVLSNTNFSGELPTSIGSLGSLTELVLASCSFTGLIPSSLGHLTQLSSLDLSGNYFSGSIPSSFSNLTQLSILLLKDNQLSGQIPSWLMNLTQLTFLELSGNNLEGSVPSSLFELVNLRALSLHANNLTGTVDLHMLSKLKNLTDFQMSDNSLSLLHYTRTNASLPKFKLLGLGGCNLTEFPDFLQNQDELEVLLLPDNMIHGVIPRWFWNTSTETLEVLVLTQNWLTGFDHPPPVLPWSRIRILDLGSNMLRGSLPIPPPSTYMYSVSGNELSGEIPALMCNLTSLKSLALAYNNFSGRIPQCFTSLSSSMSVLDLKHNNLNGAIPAFCSNPSNLRMIDLSWNQLQGQIPRSFASCTNLKQLVLENNKINDTFPSWLGSLPRLQVVILRSNLLHGAVGSPRADYGFSQLRIIDLSNNSFTGNLPWEYFRVWDAMMNAVAADDLTYLQADTGFHVPGYTWLIPYEFSMTISSKGVRRHYQKIPNILIFIDLSSNKFYGEIPESIGGLKKLQGLNLSNNALTGPIPASLANLTQLEALDLSRNKLSREIPEQLGELTFLAFFDVSHNDLTGLIPQGRQFATFPSTSFEGNPGLCGSPLSRACGTPKAPSPPSPLKEVSVMSEFDWKMVVMGYGSGLVIGVSVGYIFTSWKHEWFVRTLQKPQRKWTRIERMGLGS